MYPDQVQHFEGPDQVLNFLQRLYFYQKTALEDKELNKLQPTLYSYYALFLVSKPVDTILLTPYPCA